MTVLLLMLDQRRHVSDQHVPLRVARRVLVHVLREPSYAPSLVDLFLHEVGGGEEGGGGGIHRHGACLEERFGEGEEGGDVGRPGEPFGGVGRSGPGGEVALG